MKRSNKCLRTDKQVFHGHRRRKKRSRFDDNFYASIRRGNFPKEGGDN